MTTFALVRRVSIGILATLFALAATVLASQANELSGAPTRAGSLRILGPEQALKQYGEWRGDRLWLVLPGGLEFELVTSIDDPAIANRGDGKFHPFDVDEVQRAFDAVSYPLSGVGAEVLVLPYPRRAGFESAAAPGLILLSPGTRALSVQQQHAEAVHELGHVVQYQRLPDSDHEGWQRYRTLRGIEDAGLYSPSAPHADRPHEIFAEDFRALFGGAIANYSGSIENPELAMPSQVPGLAEFLRGLSGGPMVAASLAAWPNPARGAVAFARAGDAVAVDLYDVTGRRLATLAPVGADGSASWSWNGRDERGQRVTGIVFARPRDGRGPAVRLTLLP